ncbi:TRAP transporter small permease [Kumtagia ephedrae]|uniref:TRAP transporter small permease protein n=1 Tax=Kumtagia ephedrae TaxID=2116701 RepID=A0A2P7SLH6_9HYPH|nr:TRAP transporter small permease [Mesorhizobium ephedrae]PSJ63297.1 TRAP transporter small permease [Mesorhizobium ephedrae]
MRPAVREARRTDHREAWQVARAAGGALHTVLGIALLFVVAVNVFNATGRYLFGMSMTGADELMVYTVVWMVMAGAVLALARREHISVNLLPSYATGRWRHLLNAIHDAAALFACAYATYASYLFLVRIARLGTTSMGLGIPMTVPHAALVAGFAGLAIVAGVLLVRDLDALARNGPEGERAS